MTKLLRQAVILFAAFFVLLIAVTVRYGDAVLPTGVNIALGVLLGGAVIDGAVAAVWALKRQQRGEL